MLRFSEEMRFEEAAKIRDRIKALQHAWESQKVVAPELGDIDIIGYCKSYNMISFEVFFIRNGIMIGSKDLAMKKTDNLADKKLLHSFISQFYSKEIIPPSEIITPYLPAGTKSIEKWLKQQKGEKVKILILARRDVIKGTPASKALSCCRIESLRRFFYRHDAPTRT